MQTQKQPKLIGGQAVINGILMKNKTKAVLAIKLNNSDTIEKQTFKLKNRNKLNKVPIIRGILETISSFSLGYKCLLISAKKAYLLENYFLEDYDETKQLINQNCFSFENFFSILLSIVVATTLFLILPTVFVKLIFSNTLNSCLKSAIEGAIKLAIFIIYIAATSQSKELKNIYRFHGAEHKTIACYEAGQKLTVENIKTFSRFHPRCGTNFVLIILIISIALSSIISWKNLLIRVIFKLLILPLIVGISYETIKITSKKQNLLTKILIKPGMWLQHLTTKEPSEKEIIVAIDALNQLI